MTEILLKLKKNPRLLVIVGLAILVLIGAVIGYIIIEAEKNNRHYKGATIEVERVRKGAIERRINAPGSLTANQSVVIKPEVSGKIEELYFKGGDAKEKGDPLVKIGSKLYEAQLKEAKAKLALAKVTHTRRQKLFAKGATSKEKLDEAHSQLLVAEANVDLARTKLDHTVVKAPFDGYTGIRIISPGDSVNEQKELLSFVDLDPMKVDFKVPGNFIQLLSIGQEVKVAVDGFEGKIFEAEIEEIDSRIDPQTHSLSVRASISNESGLLKPGLFGRIIFVAGFKDDTILIPESAVDISGDEKFVYRVVKRSGYNVAERVIVTTGIEDPDTNTIEIVRGLDEGDVIVISGQVKIQDGSIVRPIGLEDEKEDEEKDQDQSTGDSDNDEAKEENANSEDNSDGNKKEENDDETSSDHSSTENDTTIETA